MKIFETKLELNADSEELLGKTYSTCNFCEKQVFQPDPQNLPFYCTFCLRNRFYFKNNTNVLILSYRGLIGYCYQILYLRDKKIYLSELDRMIFNHKNAGLENPVFYYDDENFLWFIDFNRVGKHRKRDISIAEVKQTLENILKSFNLEKFFFVNTTSTFLERFTVAVDNFYEQRKRPDDRKILCPTFNKILHLTNFDFEATRNFLPKNLNFR